MYKASVVLVLAMVFNFSGVSMASSDSPSFRSLEGPVQTLSDLGARYVLVVNVATRCGFTPQLEGLEKLAEKYKGSGLAVLGVPSNDFGSQTPENGKEIKKFCRLNHGADFPLTAKMTVKGPGKNAFVAHFINQDKEKKEIAWNFEKFLVDCKGVLIERFPSGEKAMGGKIEAAIKKLVL